MVAISLYRGNLHRVPDVPRQWLMPRQRISLKDFKFLLNRRSKALSRSAPATSSNPSPSPNPNPDGEDRGNNDITNADKNEASPVEPESKKGDVENNDEGGSILKVDASVEVSESDKDQGGSNSGDVGNGGGNLVDRSMDVNLSTGEKAGARDSGGGEGGLLDKSVDVANISADAKAGGPESAGGVCDHGSGDAGDKLAEKQELPVNVKSEVDVVPSEKEKRKKEVEEKLHILNEKKHNLVQVLKQILNVEEELKRRTTMQGMANRPPVPLQVDVTNDSGSMTRHTTPRLGSDANPGGDVEGGEADDASNHNLSSRPFARMSSTSPSESPLRRPASSPRYVVPLPSRANLVAAGSPSPSRFAPPGFQGHPVNLPSVSISGTNYIASSPSPAASGGTSVFKDARQPSPWN